MRKPGWFGKATVTGDLEAPAGKFLLDNTPLKRIASFKGAFLFWR
jgi:hypothetical protein